MHPNQIDRNATTLNPNDAPHKNRRRYNRLRLVNRLDSNGKWMDRLKQTQQDNKATIDAISSQLELTSLQKQRAYNYFSLLPESYNTAYSTPLLALCVCGISGRKDGRSYHPNVLHPNNDMDSDFAKLAKKISVSYGEFYSCWSRIEDEI